MNILKSQNSYVDHQIKMTGYYDQLHIMSNHPTKNKSETPEELHSQKEA